MAKEKKPTVANEDFNFIVRIVNTDIDGQKRVAVGIQSIKGVGKRASDIIVKKANVDRTVKMGDLPVEKVKIIEELVAGYSELVPTWILNRQSDYETGSDLHLIGNEIELVAKDDINRMKMIRCYRGVRHEGRHKTRGQRTRSNGRKGLTMGVSKRRGA